MKKRYTEQQIAYALKRAETGVSIDEIICKMDISPMLICLDLSVFTQACVGSLIIMKQGLKIRR